MLIYCSGACDTRLYVKNPVKPIYLCKRCYAAYLNVTFKMIGRGKEVFTVVKPKPEHLN